MPRARTFAISAAAGLGAALALRARQRHDADRYSFQGRTVAITGGSRGLGLVLARAFAQEGARLALLARDRAELARDNILITTVCPGLMRTSSPPNVLVKGRHRAEYAWFALADALPGLTIAADRAAHQIVEACRRGDPALTITLPARVAALANALSPRLTAHALALVNRALPKPTGPAGDIAHIGWQSQSRLAPSPLTHLSDVATLANNEVPDQATLT